MIPPVPPPGPGNAPTPKRLRGLIQLQVRYPGYPQISTDDAQRTVQGHAIGLTETVEQLLVHPPDEPPDMADRFLRFLKSVGMLDQHLYKSPLHQRLHAMARRLNPSMVTTPAARLINSVQQAGPGVFALLLVTGKAAKRFERLEGRMIRADQALSDAAEVFDEDAPPGRQYVKLDDALMDDATRQRIGKLRDTFAHARDELDTYLRRLKAAVPQLRVVLQVPSLNAMPQLHFERPASPGAGEPDPAP